MPSNFDWKQVVGTVAPAIATAFGTPVAGAAVAALSAAIFGTSKASPDDIATAIAGGNLTGEQIAAIHKADNDFKLEQERTRRELAKIDADTEAAYLADVQSARARQTATHDAIPQIILACAALFYCAQFAVFIFWHLPSDEFVRALIVRGFGTVDGIVLTCVAYFVGSSRGSKASGDAIRRIAEAPATEPAPLGSPPARRPLAP